MTESLTTASQVIDALDGTTAVAHLASQQSKPPRAIKPQHVTNWRSTGRLPPWTFLILTDALKARGQTAPPSLWGIDEPASPSLAPEGEGAQVSDGVQS